MLELTESQAQELTAADSTPMRVRNPETDEGLVLLRAEEYERMKQVDYDDSPWTPEEMMKLTWEAGVAIGWNEMDEYDDLPEKP